MATNLIPLVKAILLLDNEGKRIAVKYYTEEEKFATTAAQILFEASLFAKTQRMTARNDAEIIMFDNLIAVFRFQSDLHLYVLGDANENELILNTVLSTIFETLLQASRGQLDRRYVLEYLEQVLLAFDEAVDGGIIMDMDASSLIGRVTLRSDNEVPLSEQSFTQALASAKEQIARSFIK
eukprot:GILJ01001460.1.p1 GENE.GILJ01001460.1~~GILJ01001460.1.p1  ORF type:complete len:181 (-),score=27.06 GILJ01001460.1:211-753(-)